jgi:hypothetical protein
MMAKIIDGVAVAKAVPKTFDMRRILEARCGGQRRRWRPLAPNNDACPVLNRRCS